HRCLERRCSSPTENSINRFRRLRHRRPQLQHLLRPRLRPLLRRVRRPDRTCCLKHCRRTTEQQICPHLRQRPLQSRCQLQRRHRNQFQRAHRQSPQHLHLLRRRLLEIMSKENQSEASVLDHLYLSISTSFGLTAFCLFVACSAAQAQSDSKIVSEIRAVLESQQQAWNRGDIEGFMNGYARAATTTFVSEDKVERGWETVRDRYKKKYSDRAKMGTLAFSDLEITPLGEGAALVLGRWKLKRAQDQPHGCFTLILRRTSEGWRIVHDHTSATPPPR